MKTWAEAVTMARRVADGGLADVSGASIAVWLAAFVLEQYEDALQAKPEDHWTLARTLRIVQARCTELLEENRRLRKDAPAARECTCGAGVDAPARNHGFGCLLFGGHYKGDLGGHKVG
jgi:hypothetical protein